MAAGPVVEAEHVEHAMEEGEHVGQAMGEGDHQAMPEFPPCPYDETTDVSQGITCYFPDCNFQISDWTKMLVHVRNKHTKGYAALKDTHLHKMGRTGLNSRQAKWRAKQPKEKNADAAVEPQAHLEEGPAPKKAKKGDHPSQGEQLALASGGSPASIATPRSGSASSGLDNEWQAIQCWVRCNRDGTVAKPFECAGPCSTTPNPSVPKLAAKDASLVPASQAGELVSASPAGGQVAQGTTSTPPSQMEAMMTEMYTGFKESKKDQDVLKFWKQAVPEMRVKQVVLDEEAPTAKRHGVGRATWPKSLQGLRAALPGFADYLQGKGAREDRINYYTLGAGRALGCFEVVDGEAGPVDMDDVKVLVGIHLGKVHDLFVKTPVMDPRYTWPKDMLVGLIAYCKFWVATLRDMMICDVAGPLQKYKECVEQLAEVLSSGHLKECKEHRELGFKAKHDEDLYVFKNFPSVPGLVQPAVLKAFSLLKKIGREFAGKDELPPKVRGLVNSLITGCWHYDTFLGRKWEVEHALFEHVKKALDEGLEYIMCRFHKTAAKYGDVIKYLSPGLVQALIVYMKLPRPPLEACPYFLVPVHSTAETVCFPRSLKTFNKNFLKEAKVSPTTNQIRKVFHNKLKKMVRGERAVEDLMLLLDKHSHKTMTKHYDLRDPEDDLALAKTLVSKVLGETVAWPTDDEEQEDAPDCSLDQVVVEWSANGLDEQLQADEEEAVGEFAEEEGDEGEGFDLYDEPLDCADWPFGHLFGILPDHVPLMDELIGLGGNEHEDSAVDTLVAAPLKNATLGAGDSGTLAGGSNPTSLGGGSSTTTASASSALGLSKEEKTPEKGKATKSDKHKLGGGGKTGEKSEDVQDILADQQRYYDKYSYLGAGMGKKEKPSPGAHEAIWSAFQVWKLENSKEGSEKPPTGVWYWDLRCRLIDEHLLSRFHNWDFCRTSLRSQILKEGKGALPADASCIN